MIAYGISLAFTASLIFQPNLGSPLSWIGPSLLAILAFLPTTHIRSHTTSGLIIVSGSLLTLVSMAAGQSSSEIYLAMACILMLGLWAGQSLSGHSKGSLALTLGLSLWALTQATYALYQMTAFYSNALPANPVSWRPWGSYLTPNLMASALILWLPFLGAQAFQNKSRSIRLLALGATLAGALAFVAARSRGAWFAFFGAALLMLAYRRAWVRWLLLLSIASAWLFSQSASTHQLSDRMLLWVPAYHAFLEAPWLGYGPGAWLSAYQAAQDTLGFGVGRDPHQILLTILLASGVLGLVLLLPFLIRVTASIHRTLASSDKTNSNFYICWGLLASFLHAQVEMSFLQPLWLLSFGFAIGLIQNKVNEASPLDSAKPRQLSTLYFLVAALILAYHGGLELWSLPAALGLAGLAYFKLKWTASLTLRFDVWDWLALSLAFTPALGIYFGITPGAALSQLSWNLVAWLLWLLAREKVLSPLQGEKIASCLSVIVASIFLLGLWFMGGVNHDTQVARWFFPNDNLLAGAFWVPGVWLWYYRAASKLWLRGMSLLILAMAIAATGSRGALLALLISSLWLTLRTLKQSRRSAWKVSAFALGLTLAIYALPWPGNGFRIRFASAAQLDKDPLLYGRAEFWKLSILTAHQKPWLGWGSGSYAMAIEHQARPQIGFETSLAKQALRLDHAHNDWLELAVERGWPIAAAFALLTLLFLGMRLRQLPSQLDLSFEAIGMALLAQSFVDTVFHTPALGLATVLILAWLWPQSAGQRNRLMGLGSQSLLLGLFAFALAGALPPIQKMQGISWLSQLDPIYRVAQAKKQFEIWQKNGRLLHAKEALESVVSFYQIMPEDYRSHVSLQRVGAALFAQSDSASLDNLARLLPTWIPGSNTKGLGHFALKEYLVASIRHSAQSFPEKASLRYQNAMTYWALGLGQDAENELNAATMLEPNYARAWQWLAKVALAKGDRLRVKHISNRLYQIYALKAQIEAQPQAYDAYTTELVGGADWVWILEYLQKYRNSDHVR